MNASTFPPDPASSETVRVLLIEDEAKTLEALGEGLSLGGWSVVPVADGNEADARLRNAAPFDLIVLDWMLPGRSGVELLRLWRASKLTLPPVLMLTARDALEDRVAGLDAGADDYLTKPFALVELLARCRALLRRSQQGQAQLSCGDLRLDPVARVAWSGSKAIQLSPRESELLAYLLRHHGQVVSREMLQRDVWRELGRFTSLDNVIEVQMARLRRRLEEAGAAGLIRTVRGLGYRVGADPEAAA